MVDGGENDIVALFLNRRSYITAWKQSYSWSMPKLVTL